MLVSGGSDPPRKTVPGETRESEPSRSSRPLDFAPLFCRHARRRLIRQRAVGPFMVVVIPPGCPLASCVIQRREPLHVQGFVPQPPVETLDEPLLHRTSRPEEDQLHTLLHRPDFQRPSRELRPVVRHQHARYYWLLLAESHLTRRLFGSMLRMIAGLQPLPDG